ncbi:unnamed protein product [Phytomonas sp. EM1]|nr:unnamed protein product [Phytomonas sp. EM1]|eukprot:CCW60598.1 unnamed protein product [Phytomonas sp. isolate EM1]
MSSLAVKRAMRDFDVLSRVCATGEDPFLVSISQQDEDLFHWCVVINPPPESVYAGISYELLLSLSPISYPIEPPSIRLLTPIFNPIVSAEGKICEGLLASLDWKPTKKPTDVLKLIVESIFLNYKRYDVLNERAAELLYMDEKKFIEEVRLHKMNIVGGQGNTPIL